MKTENEGCAINIDPDIERAVDTTLAQVSLEAIWSDFEGLIEGCSDSVERSAANTRFFLNMLAIRDRTSGGRIFYFAATQQREILLRFLMTAGMSPISPKGSYVSWPLRGALRAANDELCLQLLAEGHRASVARRYASSHAQARLDELLEKRRRAADLERMLPHSIEGRRARF